MQLFNQKTNQNLLICKEHKNVCRYLNYTDELITVISTITRCVSISIWVITAGFKKYDSIIKKKEKRHNKVVLLAKYKLNSTEALFSKALVDSDISHDEFFLMNNVLKEFCDMKKENKNSNDYFSSYI